MISPGKAVILRASARSLPLSDSSVDEIVTSPPYWRHRVHHDGGKPLRGQLGAERDPAEYLENLLDCTAEWLRVLKPAGSMFVVLGDTYSDRLAQYLPQRYAIGCIDKLGLILRAEIIWSKPNAMPECVNDRVRRVHEQIFHLTRERRHYAGIDGIREPYLEPDRIRADTFGGNSAAEGVRHAGPGVYTGPRHALGRPPASIWTVNTQPLLVPAWLGVKHRSSFPAEIPRRAITGWCPPSGVVLDPFGGAGTTMAVATLLGMTGISADLSADCARIARWRMTDPREAAKLRRKLGLA